MSPMTFLKRPLRWLQMIDRYGVTIGGGPNFAYDLCLRRITDEQVAGSTSPAGRSPSTARSRYGPRRWTPSPSGSRPPASARRRSTPATAWPSPRCW